jgi:RNA polymerase sigma-70 factor, ECF subfamily
LYLRVLDLGYGGPSQKIAIPSRSAAGRKGLLIAKRFLCLMRGSRRRTWLETVARRRRKPFGRSSALSSRMNVVQVARAGRRSPVIRDVDDVYRAVSPGLWRSVYVFTGGRKEITEEAVAEAFTRAMEHWRSIQDPRAWLFRVAFRIAAAELKRESRSQAAPEPAYEPDDLRPVLDALRLLPANQRAAMVLHYRIGMPVREVAVVLGVSVPTVKVHLHRGRNRLREIFKEEDR